MHQEVTDEASRLADPSRERGSYSNAVLCPRDYADPRTAKRLISSPADPRAKAIQALGGAYAKDMGLTLLKAEMELEGTVDAPAV